MIPAECRDRHPSTGPWAKWAVHRWVQAGLEAVLCLVDRMLAAVTVGAFASPDSIAPPLSAV